MKKILFFLILGSTIFSISSIAQPTWKMPQQLVPDVGEEVCIPVKFRDFTHLFEVSFSLNWDPGVLQFSKIQGLHPTLVADYGLTMGDFDTSPGLTNNGQLTFHWDYGQGDCQTIGATLDDEETFFEVCFIIVGIYGDCSQVQITDEPLQRFVTRNNTNCSDIGEFVEDANVCTEVNPLKLIAGSGNGDNGETVCVPISVEDFDDIISMQFSINWDPSLLDFQSVTTLSLPSFQVNPHVNTTDTGNGIITVSWFDPNDSHSVPDGEVILSLCFEILGDCGDKAPIEITENPTPFEAINATSAAIGNGKEIGIFAQHGEVVANCFTPGGAEINIPNQTVNPGQDFCLDITAGANMDGLAKIQFTLGWNPGIIEFDYVTNVFEENQCQPSPFNDPLKLDSVSQGILIVQYLNNFPGCELNPGDLLFTICFKTIGPGGSSSSVAVTNEPRPICIDETGGQTENIGLNADNGLVSINQIQGITVRAGSGPIEEDPGQKACVDFMVQDFNDITRMDFSIEWESGVLEFDEITNITNNLENFDLFNFTTTTVSNGALGVEWLDFNGTGVSLDDDEVLFSVCYNVIGDPDDCSAITFTALPIDINIETTNSNNTNVGLNGIPGQVCVLDPFSFEVEIGDASGTLNSVTCVDFAVTNFNQLTNMEYSINWDIDALEYDHLEITGNLPDFTTASYDDNILLTEDGNLIIDWETNNGILGTSVNDGTVIFSVCYKILMLAPNCSNVIISAAPQDMVITTAVTGPANIGLKFTQGEICATAGPEIVDFVITPEECPGDNSGGIDLTLVGNANNFTFSWEGPGGDMYSTEDLVNVAAGNYDVTICAVSNPNLCLEETYTVIVNPNAPVADAGPDASFPCGDFSIVLDGSGSSTGPNISYFWEVCSGGGLILPGEQNEQNPQVVGVAVYCLTVTDTNTGCVVTDEVEMTQPIIPGVTIEKDPPSIIKCEPDTLTIDATQSTTGPSFVVEWETMDGGTMVDPATTSLEPQIISAGTYILLITNTQSGCVETDTLFVVEDKVPPLVEAGDPQMLGCDDVDLELLGAGSSVGNEFIYEWTTVDGEICGTIDEINLTVCGAGTYQLMITNTDNGCTAFDTVDIGEDLEKPDANAGAPKTLDCLNTSVLLDGTGSTGADFTYLWTTSDGSIVSGADSLTPTVDQDGTYTLIITDNSNGCESESDVVVDKNEETFDAVVATDAILLTCANPTDTLDATGTVIEPITLLEWKEGDANGILISNEVKHEVSAPGLYTLVVTNTESGCTSSQLVLVEDDMELPDVDAGSDKTIDCTNDTVTLDGVVENTPGLQVQWSGPGPGCFVTSANNPVVEVSCPGIYTLTVFNTENGCQSFDEVEVFDIIDYPTFETVVDGQITCKDQCVDISVINISAGSDYSVEWEKASDPGVLVGVTEVINVCDTETYIAAVTNLDNGCITEELVAVTEDIDIPVADAVNSGDVTCSNGTSIIDASGSTLNGTTVTWMAEVGSGGVVPVGMENEVSLDVIAGTYIVTIEYIDNGCTAMATTIVGEDTTQPNVNAGPNMPKDCGVDMVTLEGSGSTGGDFTYQWYQGVGTSTPIGGATDLSVQVSDVGDYTLVITDISNGCTAEDVTNVFATTDGPAATATVDVEPCSDMALLMGNLPTEATGLWTIVSGTGVFDDPTNPNALISNLTVGTTIVEWTLSLPGCDNYSSAQATITVDAFEPNASPDQIFVGNEDPKTVTFDVLQNDITNGSDVTFQIVSQPSEGSIDNISDGVITFTAPANFFGEIDFTYTICSIECPDQCDTTFVRLEYEEPEAINCELLPTGITPNNDGLNDAFFTSAGLDILYPNNSLIIFNRWGDIVYEAKPYVNDWRGTNDSGKELPTGTYYYILRLDVGESQICKGDITIIK